MIGCLKKQFFCFIIYIFLTCIITPVAYAETYPTIYSDIVTYSNKVVNVPISISDNTGLMGYKLTFTAKNLEFVSIEQGDIFTDGIFNNKIYDENKKCDVIWTNSEAVLDNGKLFVLKTKVKNVGKECSISFIYSKEDTIDGNSNEQDLICNNISLQYSGETIEENTSGNTSYDNQNDEEFILKYINTVDENTYKKAINKALKKVNAENIGSVKEKDYKAFAKEFDKFFTDSNLDVPSVSDNYSNKKAIKVIKEIGNCVSQYDLETTAPTTTEESTKKTDDKNSSNSSSVEKTKDNNNQNFFIPIVVIVSLLALAIIIILIKKKQEVKK